MNLKNNIKYLFRKQLLHTFESEIQEALVTLNEVKIIIENDFDTIGIWDIVSFQVEKTIILKSSWFIDSVNQKNKKPAELIYLWLFNNARRELDITDDFEISKKIGLKKVIELMSNKLSPINN